MKLSEHFVKKTTIDRAFVGSEDRDRYAHVLEDGKVYFYDLPTWANAEDFAASVAVAFEKNTDAREIINYGRVYRLDLN